MKIDPLEDCEIDEVLYEKKIGSSGEVFFFANGKPLTTQSIQNDVMSEVEKLVNFLMFSCNHPNSCDDYFYSIELDTNFGGCRGCLYCLEDKPDEHQNCFYLKNIRLKDIKNLSKEEIVEFIKKDLKHINVEDLELPWIETKQGK